PLPSLPYAVRGITAAALDENHLFLAGGYKNASEGFTAEAFVFDVRTRTYRPAPPLPYSAGVGLVRAGEWLYCIGGEDQMRHRTAAFYRLRWRDLLPPTR